MNMMSEMDTELDGVKMINVEMEHLGGKERKEGKMQGKVTWTGAMRHKKCQQVTVQPPPCHLLRWCALHSKHATASLFCTWSALLA